MLHFLPAVDYSRGVSLEGAAGELEPLPLPQLKLLLVKHTASSPSLVFLSARGSEQATDIVARSTAAKLKVQYSSCTAE